MIDPFDALARPSGQTEPDPVFRARLMRQVREALTADAADEVLSSSAGVGDATFSYQ